MTLCFTKMKTTIWLQEVTSVFVSYLCEVQQHSCGWISDNGETRVKRRRCTVEEGVDITLSLTHPGGETNNVLMAYFILRFLCSMI